MCLRLRDCVQHVFWPVADKPKSIARSFVIVQYGSSKYKGKRICSAGVNVGPEKIRFKREVNGRKVCKELIARIEPRGCASETGDKNHKQLQRSCTCIRSRASRNHGNKNTISEIKFSERMSALQNKQKTRKRILPFVTEYRPSVPNLKNILMSKWHLIENQPLLREIYKDPPLLSYRKGRSLKGVLVRAKL